ncbi:hypothetical protein CDAR_33721 [Caerostris darwini]|uniref:Exophilin 5 n=1 Tax=Caerostris darwini TaxID=1538125 RepID=A0AAV4UNF5_9ARAC|nr:hypothetical protein CDAR_33721 [Caerostris darwini]
MDIKFIQNQSDDKISKPESPFIIPYVCLPKSNDGCVNFESRKTVETENKAKSGSETPFGVPKNDSLFFPIGGFKKDFESNVNDSCHHNQEENDNEVSGHLYESSSSLDEFYGTRSDLDDTRSNNQRSSTPIDLLNNSFDSELIQIEENINESIKGNNELNASVQKHENPSSSVLNISESKSDKNYSEILENNNYSNYINNSLKFESETSSEMYFSANELKTSMIGNKIPKLTELASNKLLFEPQFIQNRSKNLSEITKISHPVHYQVKLSTSKTSEGKQNDNLNNSHKRESNIGICDKYEELSTMKNTSFLKSDKTFYSDKDLEHKISPTINNGDQINENNKQLSESLSNSNAASSLSIYPEVKNNPSVRNDSLLKLKDVEDLDEIYKYEDLNNLSKSPSLQRKLNQSDTCVLKVEKHVVQPENSCKHLNSNDHFKCENPFNTSENALNKADVAPSLLRVQTQITTLNSSFKDSNSVIVHKQSSDMSNIDPLFKFNEFFEFPNLSLNLKTPHIMISIPKELNSDVESTQNYNKRYLIPL